MVKQLSRGPRFRRDDNYIVVGSGREVAAAATHLPSTFSKKYLSSRRKPGPPFPKPLILDTIFVILLLIFHYFFISVNQLAFLLLI